MEPFAIQNVGIGNGSIDFPTNQPLLIQQLEFKGSSRRKNALELSALLREQTGETSNG